MRLGNAPASSQAFPRESLSFHRHLVLTLAKYRAEWKNLLYLFEDFVLDADRRELRRKGRVLPVEPKVFDLLVLLIINRDRVVSKDDLIARIWDGRIVSESALTTCITAARSVIGDSGETQRLIKTLPRKGIRFVGVVREETDTNTQAESSGRQLALPDKPSVAVLPFADMGPKTEQEYFADGITEDIITELSRFSELFVIARNSSFRYKGESVDIRQVGRELGVRYVLEGSIRRSADRVRISAQLIDAKTGVHRWAERYDRKLEDVFAVQDEVARTIAAVLAAHVSKAETERTLNKPPATWQAYDYYVRAAWLWASYNSSYNVEDLYGARRLLEHSLLIDPNYARAHAKLSNTYTLAWHQSLDADFLSPAALDRADELARKAIQLDPNLPDAHAQLGMVLTWRGQHDAGIGAFEKAFALNPNFTDYRFAISLVLGGECERAIEVVRSNMRLDPSYSPMAPAWLGAAYFMLGRQMEALPPLRESVSRAPNFRAGHVWLAAAYAKCGYVMEAQAEAIHVLRIQSNYTINTQRRLYAFKRFKDAEHLFDGLRMAGLPE
jgi:adenylate cyclase